MRRGLCACLVTLVALGCMLAGVGAQQTLSLDCCTVLNQLYTYMKVADSYKCTGLDSSCASVKLIQLFVNHSRSYPHGIDMRAQGAEILVTGRYLLVGTFLKVHTRPRLAYALRCRGY